MKKQSVIVIVDGFGAGRFFVNRLNARGYVCIHLQSTPEPMCEYYTLRNPEDYLELYAYQDDSTIAQISEKYDVLAVIPGSEPGVYLAHQLAQHLNLKRNKDDLLSARRNKFDMIEALKKNHLKTVSHYKTNNFNQAKQWILAHGSWPIVVKPLDSVGGDHVYICHNIQEAETPFNRVLNNKTVFNRPCHEILFQSYLAGEEYVVNIVSCNGKHFISELRMYHKQNLNGHHIYDYEELLNFNGEIQQQLIEYAIKVVEAVGIQYGASHIEIMLTADGPILVEIAARISGATHIDVSNETLGYNIVDLTIESYLEEEKFMAHIAKNDKQIIKFENVIDIATEKQGYIDQLPPQEKITEFPSVKNTKFNVKVGDYLKPTVSLANSPAKIHLVHHDMEQITKDRSAIKSIFLQELACSE